MTESLWFENSVIYQIYVKSFKDSNGDGIGDLSGLISKLDYIEKLGVNAIYLNPVTKQQDDINLNLVFDPQKEIQDNQFYIINSQMPEYLTVDFKAIEPKFGTLDDFKKLIEDAHQRKIKIILDFIALGPSLYHKFFIDLLQNGDKSSYKDWFMTSDRPIKELRNLGNGPREAWNRLPHGEYYYSIYGIPMFNYKNPEVQAYMHSVFDFWLDLGVDGFRLDALKHLFINGPGKEEHQPQLFEYIQEVKAHILEKYGKEKVLIAEVLPLPGIGIDYFGKKHQMIDLLWDNTFYSAFFSQDILDLDIITFNHLNEIQSLIPAHKLAFFSNHDIGRIMSHIVNPTADKAKLLAALLLLGNGNVQIYYGDEIGLEGGLRPSITQTQKNITSMSWNLTPNNCGFSTNPRPSVYISEDCQQHNVQFQEGNKHSILNYYRELIHFRRKYPVFAQGERRKTESTVSSIYSYFLYDADQVVLVVNNLRNYAQNYQFDMKPYVQKHQLKLIFSGHKEPNFFVQEGVLTISQIEPYQSLVFLLTEATEKEVIPEFPDSSCALPLDDNNLGKGNAYKVIHTDKKSESLTDIQNEEKTKEKEKEKVDKKCPQEILMPQSVRKFKENYENPALFFENIEGKIKVQTELYSMILSGKNVTLPVSKGVRHVFFTSLNGEDKQNAPIPFRIKNSSLEEMFKNVSLVEAANEPSNKSLKSFSYGSDDNYWYFKIAPVKKILGFDSGINLALCFHHLEKSDGATKIGIWGLPGIKSSLSIDSMLLYDEVHDTANLYIDVNQYVQPGAQLFKTVFEMTEDAFYIILNRNALPDPQYDVALLIWSAGGLWGDLPPKQWPITEMLPYDSVEMTKEHPDYLKKFTRIVENSR